MGVTIGNFRDFYREILEREGIFLAVISLALGHRLVQETLGELYTSGELTHFSTIMNKPGFLLALQEAFAELRRASCGCAGATA